GARDARPERAAPDGAAGGLAEGRIPDAGPGRRDEEGGVRSPGPFCRLECSALERFRVWCSGANVSPRRAAERDGAAPSPKPLQHALRTGPPCPPPPLPPYYPHPTVRARLPIEDTAH